MATRESEHFRPGERAYILNYEFLPVYTGEGLGDLDYKDAIDLSIIKRTGLGLPTAKVKVDPCILPAVFVRRLVVIISRVGRKVAVRIL